MTKKGKEKAKTSEGTPFVTKEDLDSIIQRAVTSALTKSTTQEKDQAIASGEL